MGNANWSAAAAAFLQKGGDASDAISAIQVAELLMAAGAPELPTAERLEHMAVVIRGLQVALQRFPTRGKRQRGDAISSALGALARVVPPEGMIVIHAIVERHQPPVTDLPTAHRWHATAAALAALYFNEVDNTTGWFRDGPAIGFIEKVLARLVPKPPTRSAIAEALRAAGIQRKLGTARK
jgi:hypothetical protein